MEGQHQRDRGIAGLVEALKQLHSMHRAFSQNENWTILDEEARAMAEAAMAKAKGGAA
jgi:hypothetical protein